MCPLKKASVKKKIPSVLNGKTVPSTLKNLFTRHYAKLRKNCEDTVSLKGPAQIQNGTEQLRLNQSCRHFPQMTQYFHSTVQYKLCHWPRWWMEMKQDWPQAPRACDYVYPALCKFYLVCMWQGSSETPDNKLQFRLCDLVEGMYTILNALSSLS